MSCKCCASCRLAEVCEGAVVGVGCAANVDQSALPTTGGVYVVPIYVPNTNDTSTRKSHENYATE